MPTAVENVITGTGTHIWQRYEMEVHGKACMNFISKILDGMTFGELYKSLMRNAIEFFKSNKSNKNKAYWSVVDWWADFLEGAGKASLAEPEKDVDLGRLLRWIRVSVVPSLHLLDEIGQKKGFDIYEEIKIVLLVLMLKKQERLKEDALSMPDADIKNYLKEFEDGDY